MSIAFVYPGQGAQRPGMGRSLFETSPEARASFALASETLGRDMAALCFEADETELNRTENAQPALFTVSMAAHRALAAAGVFPAIVAGFSLGECAALCAAGRLSWADGLRLVAARARAMQAAAASVP
ncbi:MAG: acyltransferase domain-containing protein, partial [Oscillospiraceae bacterium]|nr:acyltransferase domain-containing protein [Oscillospiraceae bacterium]